MKLRFFAVLLPLVVSATSHAALLSCESNDVGESRARAFTGIISESETCGSGYSVKIARSKLCLLRSPSARRFFTGEVRGCGYNNGSAFVVTDTLPLGAE